jgi:tryptophanyl-tRNA synthetase
MTQNSKPTLLSGVKPTGRPHLGNYFGAMKRFVELQEAYQSFIMIADLHALTSVQSAEKLREDILGVALDYLAIGLDPAKVTIFQQSAVPAHAELAWIFNCLTTLPYLARAHAYKDALAKNKEVNVGLFTYPLLMAADILLYDANAVPVGLDQKQHLEIARDLAEKFNRLYGETFTLPEPLIQEEVQTVIGLDGQKMSKSYGNTIPLFAEDEEIDRLVMSIVTDSAGERPANVYNLHTLFRSKSELDELYDANKGQYKILKEALAADIKKLVAPLRAKRAEIAKDPEMIKQILAAGAKQANEKAGAKIKLVKKAAGLI